MTYISIDFASLFGEQYNAYSAWLSNRGGSIKRSLIAASALVMGLAGCESDAEPGDVLTEAPLELPAFVQELIDTDFPADGEIHVRNVGGITISPDTPICFWPDGFWVDANELFEALGQQASVSSGSRLRPAVEGQCDLRDDLVLIKGVHSTRTPHGSYQLTLAVWQSGAAWVGSIGRSPRGQKPRIFNPYGTEALPLEVNADAEALSHRFIEFVQGAV